MTNDNDPSFLCSSVSICGDTLLFRFLLKREIEFLCRVPLDLYSRCRGCWVEERCFVEHRNLIFARWQTLERECSISLRQREEWIVQHVDVRAHPWMHEALCADLQLRLAKDALDH